MNAGAVTPRARSGVVYHIDASYFIFRAYHSMPSEGIAEFASAKLLAHKEAAYLAWPLTRIICDLPLETTLDDLKPRPPDSAGLDCFFDTHGFGNILRQQARRIAAGA